MSALYLGTSGFAYATWKPGFYPADLKSADLLGYYAERFPSVEINNTFYRAPSEKVLRTWLDKTPADFRFTLKAPQRITHFARLRNAEEPLGAFLQTARALGDRLGCVLFQLPPTLKRDDDLLDGFLKALAGEPFRFAMEFRHESWDEDVVRARLGDASVAWCVAEEEQDLPLLQTAAGFVYARLRRGTYDDERLAGWADDIARALANGTDAYVYFKHEDEPTGPRQGARLRELIAERYPAA